MQEIISKLRDNTLEKLLINHKLSDEDVKEIAAALNENRSVIEINLSRSGMSANAAETILLAILKNDKLQKLDLSFNKIGIKGVKALTQVINNIPLKHLNLSCTQIGVEGAKVLANFLQKNTSLEEIDFNNCQIQDEGVTAIIDNLTRNPNCSLKYLTLESNNITLEGAKKIAGFLQLSATLHHIDLSSNHLKSEGIKLVAKALENNHTLTMLGLSATYFNSAGAYAIADMFRRNNTIKQLFLAQNDDMGKHSLTIIATSLKSNYSVCEIDLWGSEINDDGATSLADALRSNSAIKKIDLHTNNIGLRGAKALAESLECNNCLQELNLEGNSIPTEGARAFSESLKHNFTLIGLKLDRNDIAEVQTSSINKLIKRNQEIAANEQFTPLLWASYHGNIDALGWLLDVKNSHRARVEEEKDGEGATALLLAVANDQLQVFQILLENQANIAVKDNQNRTVLIYAAMNNSHRLLQWIIGKNLLTPQDYQYKDAGGQIFLHLAAQRGHFEIFKTLDLIKDKALIISRLIEEKDNQGRTPIHLAAGSGSIEVIRWLIENNANVGVIDVNNKYPLHLAAENGHLLVVNLLRQKMREKNIAIPKFEEIAASEMEPVDNKLISAKQSKIAPETEVKELKKRLRKWADELQQKENELGELSKKLSEETAEKENFKDKMTQIDRQFRTQTDEMQKKQNKLDDLSKKLAKENDENEKFRSKMAQFEIVNSESLRKIQEVNAELNKERTQNKHIIQEKQQLQTTLKKIISQQQQISNQIQQQQILFHWQQSHKEAAYQRVKQDIKYLKTQQQHLQWELMVTLQLIELKDRISKQKNPTTTAGNAPEDLNNDSKEKQEIELKSKTKLSEAIIGLEQLQTWVQTLNQQAQDAPPISTPWQWLLQDIQNYMKEGNFLATQSILQLMPKLYDPDQQSIEDLKYLIALVYDFSKTFYSIDIFLEIQDLHQGLLSLIHKLSGLDQLGFYQQVCSFYWSKEKYEEALFYYSSALDVWKKLSLQCDKDKEQQLNDYQNNFKKQLEQLEIGLFFENTLCWLKEEISIAKANNSFNVEEKVEQLLLLADKHAAKAYKIATEADNELNKLFVEKAWKTVTELYKLAEPWLKSYRDSVLLEAVEAIQDEKTYQENYRKLSSFLRKLIQHHQYSLVQNYLQLFIEKLADFPALRELFSKQLADLERYKKGEMAVEPIDDLLSMQAWKFYERIESLRQNVRNDLPKKDDYSMLFIQKNYLKTLRQLLEDIIQHVAKQWLGEPPCVFNILGVGSLGRGDISPYSDIDIVILVTDDHQRKSPYFTALVNCLNAYLMLLGDRYLLLQNSKLSVGIRLDSGDISDLKGEQSLINTPEGLTKWLMQRDNLEERKGLVTYSLYYPTLLYASTKEGGLLKELQQKLIQSFTNLQREVSETKIVQLAEKNFSFHRSSFLNLQKKQIKSVHDLKKYYLEPLIYWCLDTGLYCGYPIKVSIDFKANKTSTIVNLLTWLSEQKYLVPEFTKKLQKYFEILQRIRYRLQLQFRGQLDNILLSNQNDNQSLYFLPWEPIPSLTSREEEHLDCVTGLLATAYSSWPDFLEHLKSSRDTAFNPETIKNQKTPAAISAQTGLSTSKLPSWQGFRNALDFLTYYRWPIGIGLMVGLLGVYYYRNNNTNSCESHISKLLNLRGFFTIDKILPSVPSGEAPGVIETLFQSKV